MRAGGNAIAVEENSARCELIARNAHHLGVPDLKIIHGTAPAVLADLPQPDAAFIGGGITDKNIDIICWNALKAQGVFAANAVTLEGEAKLSELWQKWGGEITRLQISRLSPLGTMQGWKPFMPVSLYHTKKGQVKGDGDDT